MSKAEWSKTATLIRTAGVILEEQHPMTIRQLFYRLVSVGAVQNTPKDYHVVIRLMTKARMDERIDFDYIVDRSRPEYKSTVWEDTAAFTESVMRGYRRDYWNNQPRHVEVWVEKDAIIGSIEPITSELGVIIRVGRGYVSTTKVHDIAEYFHTIRKPITVFYLGDHDPSGKNIEVDLYQRLIDSCCFFEFERLAIFGEDIKSFNLPPLRIKDTDTRASKFKDEHGSQCVELDALPPDELRSRLQTAIVQLIDIVQWNRDISVEKAEFESIQRTVDIWKNLPKVQDIEKLDRDIQSVQEML